MFISLLYRTPTKSKLLHREVVRLVTPGTLLEPLNSDANYLMSIAQGPDSSLGLAWLDLSTGEFYLEVSSIDNLDEDLARVNPAEVCKKDFAYNCPKGHTKLDLLYSSLQDCVSISFLCDCEYIIYITSLQEREPITLCAGISWCHQLNVSFF